LLVNAAIGQLILTNVITCGQSINSIFRRRYDGRALILPRGTNNWFERYPPDEAVL
jgi:hypothetical protein